MNTRHLMGLVPAAASSLLAACVLGSVVGPNRAIVQDAAALVKSCRYEEAETLIQTQLPRVPDRYRGELMLSQGQIDEARGQLTLAIEHYAASAAAASRGASDRAGRLLGRAQVRNRQFEDGYQTLQALTPDASPLLLMRDFDWTDMTALAVAAAETGRLADASIALGEAFRLSSQPYDPVIPQLRAQVTAAQAGSGSVEPGSFWKLAYGTEGVGLSLDTRPVAVRRELSDIPGNAKAERAGGYIVVFLNINEAGRVAEAKVLEAYPPGLLEVTSVAAVRDWEFEPALEQCKAVAAAGIQRFEFGQGR